MDGNHLIVFSENIAFARHFVAPRLPPPFHPIGVLGYTSKKLSKMAGNSASYPDKNNKRLQ